MSPSPPIRCHEFEVEAADLALGFVDEPRRSELNAHAAGCRRCERVLGELALVSDRMLELAVELEPPAGFEERAVVRMAAPPARRRHRAVVAAAAAALVVGLLVGSVAVAARRDDGSIRRAAPVVAVDGDRLGTVEIEDAARPRLVITMDGESDWSGTWTFEVLGPEGRWVAVGQWTADDVVNGVWAAGLHEGLSSTPSMRILGRGGAVVATASLPD